MTPSSPAYVVDCSAPRLIRTTRKNTGASTTVRKGPLARTCRTVAGRAALGLVCARAAGARSAIADRLTTTSATEIIVDLSADSRRISDSPLTRGWTREG